MTSYDTILKWAKEAKALLKQGRLDGVKTNLSMIVAQAKDEIKKERKVRTNKRCACGLPLHYNSKEVQAEVEKTIAEHGEYVPVHVPGEGGIMDRYLVQRHYIALHGLNAPDLPRLLKEGIVRRG